MCICLDNRHSPPISRAIRSSCRFTSPRNGSNVPCLVSRVKHIQTGSRSLLTAAQQTRHSSRPRQPLAMTRVFMSFMPLMIVRERGVECEVEGGGKYTGLIADTPRGIKCHKVNTRKGVENISPPHPPSPSNTDHIPSPLKASECSRERWGGGSEEWELRSSIRGSDHLSNVLLSSGGSDSDVVVFVRGGDWLYNRHVLALLAEVCGCWKWG